MTHRAFIQFPAQAEAYSYWPVVARGDDTVTVKVTAESADRLTYLVQYQLDRLASGMYVGTVLRRTS